MSNEINIEALVARLRAVSETGCDPDLPHEAADMIEALAQRAEDAEQLATARGHTIQGLRQELAGSRMECDALSSAAKTDERIAWRLKPSIDPCGLMRYITQRMFEQQTPGVKRWYEPYRCANCSTTARVIEAAVLERNGLKPQAKGAGSAYGPNNPPRLRRPDESVDDYRAAMGWSRAGINNRSNGD